MRGLRIALLVMTATGLVLGSRFVVSARDAGTVISACVQNANGSIRIINGGGCKSSETLMQWNQQGPMGPVGPAAPPSSGPAAGASLHVLDSTGTTVGDWQSPSYVSMTINSETVFVGLDLSGQTFMGSAPALFYTDTACATPPMMFLDMTHYGVVQNGVLSYPSGGLASTTYNSVNMGGGCVKASGTGTYGLVAHANVASFVAPFSLSH